MRDRLGSTREGVHGGDERREGVRGGLLAVTRRGGDEGGERAGSFGSQLAQGDARGDPRVEAGEGGGARVVGDDGGGGGGENRVEDPEDVLEGVSRRGDDVAVVGSGSVEALLRGCGEQRDRGVRVRAHGEGAVGGPASGGVRGGVRDGAGDEVGEGVGAPRGGDGGGEAREMRTERGGAVGAAEEGEHLPGHRGGVRGGHRETFRPRLGAEHRRAERAHLKSLAARAQDRARDDPPRSGGLRRAEMGIRRDQRRVVGRGHQRPRSRERGAHLRLRHTPARVVPRDHRRAARAGVTTSARSSHPNTKHVISAGPVLITRYQYLRRRRA